MNGAENLRQLFRGPGMKANAIRIPSQPRHDHLGQFIAVAWQWHGVCLDAAHGGQEQFLRQQGSGAQCDARAARPQSRGLDLGVAQRARRHGFFRRQPRVLIRAALDTGQIRQGFSQRANRRVPRATDARTASSPERWFGRTPTRCRRSTFRHPGTGRRCPRFAAPPYARRSRGRSIDPPGASAKRSPQASLRRSVRSPLPMSHGRNCASIGQLAQAFLGLPLNGFDRTCTASSHPRDSTPRGRIALLVPPIGG